MPRVLVVDDDRIVRSSLGVTLEIMGYDVELARRSVAALGIQAERPADVVITDWVMPGLSGEELIRALRDRGSEVPVIVVSGADPVPDPGLRISAVLGKPVMPSQLAQAIDRALTSPAG